ncbi:MAG: hypothetical protein KDB82_12585 [Planctomycetes bacterium]|nr:hypothetical protein [Planctomycetota bacterium]
MKRVALLIAVAAAFALSGCTFFQDDVYKAQAGYYLSDDFGSVENAIHDELADRYGKEAVFRPDVEWKYNNWTVITEQRAVGLEKYRTRIMAYPQLDADGQYEPVVIARQEVYTGYGYGSTAGPTAMYSGKWTEAGRDTTLEASLSNGIYTRLHPATDANAGGK